CFEQKEPNGPANQSPDLWQVGHLIFLREAMSLARILPVHEESISLQRALDFLELFQLRADHGGAVRRIRPLLEIFLMVFFRWITLRQCHKLRDNGLRELLLRSFL